MVLQFVEQTNDLLAEFLSHTNYCLNCFPLSSFFVCFFDCKDRVMHSLNQMMDEADLRTLLIYEKNSDWFEVCTMIV